LNFLTIFDDNIEVRVEEEVATIIDLVTHNITPRPRCFFENLFSLTLASSQLWKI